MFKRCKGLTYNLVFYDLKGAKDLHKKPVT